ncbi:MAG: phosphate propanoyltransferase [Clostridia bacterium]|nr:phosphate propanoyltransferase [Clostridia bacterium]
MEKKFIVETSARHIHVTAETFVALFGANAELHNKKDLSQPGQYACEERVKLVGPKGEMAVTILGPFRPADQVELSFTDARALGLVAVPVRESGDVAGTPGLTLVGPVGEVEIAEGVIVAKRHIHMTPADAALFGVADKQTVQVRVDGTRPLVFDDVVVRVSDKFALAMHIDTDECNAAGAFGAIWGEIV